MMLSELMRTFNGINPVLRLSGQDLSQIIFGRLGLYFEESELPPFMQNQFVYGGVFVADLGASDNVADEILEQLDEALGESIVAIQVWDPSGTLLFQVPLGKQGVFIMPLVGLNEGTEYPLTMVLL